MKPRPQLTNVSKAVIEYIKDLEAVVYGFSRIEQELRLTCDVWAEKLADLRSKENLISEKKHHDWVLSILRETAKIRALTPKSQKGIAPQVIDEVEEVSEDETEPVQQKRLNIQDFVIKTDE